MGRLYSPGKIEPVNAYSKVHYQGWFPVGNLAWILRPTLVQRWVFHFKLFAMKGRKFKQSMLEYCKIILMKISFDKKLFRKEYRKTFLYLEANEHHELKKWIREKIGVGNRLFLNS
jgi:hypothetical protein